MVKCPYCDEKDGTTTHVKEKHNKKYVSGKTMRFYYKDAGKKHPDTPKKGASKKKDAPSHVVGGEIYRLMVKYKGQPAEYKERMFQYCKNRRRDAGILSPKQMREQQAEATEQAKKAAALAIIKEDKH
jgi:hypothetical protein